MACRKGDFYILQKGYIPKKVSGYIIDERFGFCRDTFGRFYPTELRTGARVSNMNWDMIIEGKYNDVYNLLNAYRAFIESGCYKKVTEYMKNPGELELKCMKVIEKAYKSDNKKL